MIIGIEEIDDYLAAIAFDENLIDDNGDAKSRDGT